MQTGQTPPFRPPPASIRREYTGRVSVRRGLFGRLIPTVQERFEVVQGWLRPVYMTRKSKAAGDVWLEWRDATAQDLEEMGHQLMESRRGEKNQASNPAA